MIRAGHGRVLVTGSRGFVGRHLVSLLRGEEAEVVAPSRDELDLLDADATAEAIACIQPSSVYHLAALASVARSWEAPQKTLIENLQLTSNLLEALRVNAPETNLVHVSSGEIYGAPAKLPVDEHARLQPRNPYAVAKAACDLLVGQYGLAHKMHVVRARPFNHCGPGQTTSYVVGSLTRQVAAGELAAKDSIELEVGALGVARDFLDVRDVVSAYRCAASTEPGVYNVCSGRSLQIRQLIEELQGRTSVELIVSTDSSLLRKADTPEVRGSAAKLQEATGWKPTIDIGRTLADAIEDWKTRLTV